jgi:hypothetical protein
MNTFLIRRSIIRSAHGILGIPREVHGSSVVNSVAPARVSSGSFPFEQCEFGMLPGAELSAKGFTNYHTVASDYRPNLGRDSAMLARTFPREVYRPKHEVSVAHFSD